LDLLKITQILKELAEHSQTAHSMNLDIDVLLRAKAREREAIDRIQKLLSEPLAFGPSARRCLGSFRSLDCYLLPDLRESFRH
jgi:hypothetical protein